MYSRYQNNSEREPRPPKNYSGWAFAERKKESRPIPPRIDVALPSPPPESVPTSAPPKNDAPPTLPIFPPPLPEPPSLEEHAHKAKDAYSDKREVEANQKQTCDEKKRLGLPAGLGKSFPFSHGIGSDELILLGLIVLLSQNDHDTDLPLWLTLLLFSG